MLSQIVSWVTSCVGAFRSRVVLIDIDVRAIRYLRCHRHESSQRLAERLTPTFSTLPTLEHSLKAILVTDLIIRYGGALLEGQSIETVIIKS